MAESLPVTDTKNLAFLRTKIHQDRRRACSNLRPVFGLDTETYRGNIFLMADSDGSYLDDITPDSCLKWLFSKRFQGSWNFFYNLSYDAEVILKLLGDNLESYRESGSLTFHYDDFTLDYIPARKLSIRKGHHSSVFFDIAQFYHTTLANAYQQNIAKLPDDYLSMKEKRSEFSPRYYSRNKIKVRNYCIDDCIYAKELSEHWIKLFYDAFSFYPNRWISSGYLAEKVLINNGIDIPKFDATPYAIQDLAYKSYFGGRFEILKRGFIGNGYLYDINSAYPFALTQIPDITNGKWIKSKSIHKYSKLGFFKIECDIPDDYTIPPFPFRTNHIIIFPTGKFVTYCTLSELQACKDVSLYRILEGYQFIPHDDIYPYREFINQLYQKRMKLKEENNPLQLPIKIILNSIYGKTGQRIRGKIGNLFNPIIFASITGIARAQLYEFVMSNNLQKDVVSFATDSVITTKKLGINSTQLGEFSLDNEAQDVFILQNGIYRFDKIWKQRGLGKLGTLDIEHFDTYEKNGKLYAKFIVLRNSRLRSSILQNNISGIGIINEIEREINLNADRKRLWLGEISSINSKVMCESVPISFNQFKKENV